MVSVGLVLLVALTLSVPCALAQSRDVYRDLRDAAMRPLPRLPPAPRGSPDPVWVPDRHVRVPGGGEVHVPGHWERPLPSGEAYVPPLLGVGREGLVHFPAGPRAPADRRDAP